MPYTLKTQQISVKDPDSGEYIGVDVLTEQTKEGLIAELQAEGDTQIERINQAAVDVQSAVDQAETEAQQLISSTQSSLNTLETQKDTIAQTIASMAELGTDTTLTTAGMAADAKATGDEISNVKNAIGELEDEAVRTVNGAHPDENGNVELNVIMTNDAADLFGEVLSEAFYGSDQRDNINSLIALLKGHNLVSLSAELDGLALVGTPYSELDFIVTGTYSDDTTATVYHYTVSSGTVVDGSNIVTISYRGISTSVTFNATTVIPHSVTYNLRGITSSNTDTIVAEGSSYVTEFTVDDNYTFNSCVVTMGGVDITSSVFSNLEILIQEVTGDITITAIAIENRTLDILKLTSKNRHSVVYSYSDYYETQSGRYNNVTYAYVSEYPALNACRIKWKITNNTAETISIQQVCGIGSIPAFGQSWKTDAYLRVAYYNKITISGDSLDPGASLEGYYDLHAGHQLVVLLQNTALDVELIGAYESDTFTGYTKLTSTASQTYGSYRTIQWYADNGSTLIYSWRSAQFNLYDKSLGAGQYDVIARLVPKVDSYDKDFLGAGGAADNTSTTINNSFGLTVDDAQIWAYIWVSGSMILDSDNMDLVSGLRDSSKFAIELYAKERV